MQQTTSGQHEAGNIQRTTDDMQRATGNMRQHLKQHASGNTDKQRNRHRAAGNMQRAPDIRRRGKDNGCRVTDNRQQGNRQQAACRRHRAENHKANNRERATGNGQHAADSSQQTTCKRTREHARCNGKHTALPHFVCGGQRASSIMREALYLTTSAQHGTDAMNNDATYERGRNMQQTRMKIHGVRRTKSGSSRTSGLCRARCWTLGGGPTARKCEG
jgi:hypothetical protein